MPAVDDLQVALEAARAGARVVRRLWTRRPATEYKGPVDPVTAADRESQGAILAVLAHRRRGEPVLIEEAPPPTPGERLWIADPLDGTVNFIHGLPHCAVSVALQEQERVVAAATVDIFRREEFTADRGAGARLDGRPIAVSTEAELARALLSTGFPYDRHEHGRAYADGVAAALLGAQGLRRLGSACLDLAWVACGRLDGHWEFGLQPWDAAAGMLLVREAGGRVTDSYGGEARPSDLVASNGAIHDALTALVAAHRPSHFSR